MNLRIPKKTGTYADALCALGYASLMQELTAATARIEECGSEYEVTCNGGHPAEQWQAPSPGYIYIWRRSKEPESPPAIAPVMDYENERAIAESLKAARSRKARKAVESALEEVSDQPLVENDPEYRFAAIIESMRKGWASDKALFRWIYDNAEQCLDVARCRLNGEPRKLACGWSNSQLLNPSTGKGVHAAKTVAKSAAGFSLVDEFDEWMKLRGLFVAMQAYRSGDDFKFLVLEPGDIAVNHLKALRNELRDLRLWGIVRLDIESVLRLLQLLMRHSEYEGGEIPVYMKRPNQIVRGLRQSFFKSLGTAAALMNDALLPLPAWFMIEGRDDVEAYLEIATEPYGEKGGSGPLTPLRDDHSSDIGLLQLYRRWLASGLLEDLLEFHAAFGIDLMQRKAANEFAPAFQTRILHLLLSKGYDVKEVIESPGFQSIARAIRNTTIYAVGMKSSNREVRFGLAQNLKQRIKAGDKEFLAALSDFVQQQNWEVTHKLGGKGHVVTTSDLNDVVELTEKHHAEIVGMLLLAYGFSRAEATGPREDAEAEVASTAAE